MFLKFRGYLSAGLLFLSLGASGQTSIGLSQILHMLQQNAPSLASDSMITHVFQQKLVATRYNWWPNLRANLQAGIGTNNNLPGGFFSNGLVPSNSKVREAGTSNTILTDLGVISFDWEIFNFGAYDAQHRVASSDLQVQKLNYEQRKYQLQQGGIEVYLRMVLMKELIGIQDQSIERNGDIKRIIRALAISGIKAGVDTSIADAELSSARLVKLDLVKQFNQMQYQLSYLTGMSPEIIEVDSLLENKIISRYLSFMNNQTTPDIHPILRYYESIRENSVERENLIKKEYMPRVLLQASVWGRGSSVSAQDRFRPLYTGIGIERANYLMGVGITYNIFDFKRKQLQQNIQKANTQLAEKRLEEETALLKNRRKQNMIELTTAYQRLQEIPRQLQAATAAYRQKLALYRNGLTNILELNTALSVLYRAEIDHAQAKYYFSKAVFDQALLENQLPALLQTLN